MIINILKNLTTLFFYFLLSIQLLIAETVNKDELVLRGGPSHIQPYKYFKKFTNKLFTGTVEKREEYDANILLEQFEVKNGIMDGEYLKFWSDGQLHIIVNYKNGKKEGLEQEFEGAGYGTLVKKIEWKDGKKNGKFTIYKHKQSIRLGALAPKCDNICNITGQFTKAMRSSYNADFNTSTYEYKNGLRHGKYKQCKYKFFRKKYNSYKPSSICLYDEYLSEEGIYKNGKKHGLIIFYNEDETIRATYNYIDGNILNPF